MRLRGSRRSRLLAAASVVGAASVLLAACGSSGTPALSASSLMKKALHNALTQGWVHEVATETSGKYSLKTDDVIGTNSGRQSIQVAGTIATVLFVGDVIYVKGNEQGMIHYLGLSTKHAIQYKGKWISVRPSNNAFKVLSTTPTLSGDFAQYKLDGPLVKKKAVELDGVKVTPILGTVPGTEVRATMYVTASTPYLPVEITANTYNSTIKWSDWGVAVALSAPTSSIPISIAES